MKLCGFEVGLDQPSYKIGMFFDQPWWIDAPYAAPILSYVVEEARAAGIEHIVFIVGRGQGAIEDYFDASHEIAFDLDHDVAAALAAGRTDVSMPPPRKHGNRWKSPWPANRSGTSSTTPTSSSAAS